MRWQKVAHLVLRTVGLGVGQSKMCSGILSGRTGREFQNIRCGVEKNNIQKGRHWVLANPLSVGCIVIYVFGHLSKWFTFSEFLVACLSLWCRPLHLNQTTDRKKAFSGPPSISDRSPDKNTPFNRSAWGNFTICWSPGTVHLGSRAPWVNMQEWQRPKPRK